jgi:5-methylcytosine-specific restriction enzyme A
MREGDGRPGFTDIAAAPLPRATLSHAGASRPQALPCSRLPAWTSAERVARVGGRRLQRMGCPLRGITALRPVPGDDPEIISLAVIRDHIIPLAEGGADDGTNTQAVCQSCSDAKTSREATRGRQRAW